MDRIPASALERRKALALLILLVAATLAAYAPVARNDFLHVDDNTYVTDNPHVQGGLSPGTVGWAFTTSRGGNWHPLTWLSHALDCGLFGLRPAGHHLVNVALHAASVAGLFLLMFRMTRAPGRSVFVAALFALHPLHVESVAWVAERKDVLGAFFWIATTWAYVLWVERPSPARYAAVCVLYALGLMSKPMLVTLPFALLLLDVWPLGRGARMWRDKIPLLVLAAAASLATFLVQRAEGAMKFAATVPFGQRAENAVVSSIAYLAQTVRPTGLGFFYPFPKEGYPAWEVAGAALALVAATAGAWLARKRAPWLPVGWLWYLGTLVPVIGLVQVGAQARADRYTYVPLIGISIAVAWGADAIAARFRGGRAVLAAAAILVALCWTLLTRAQLGYWKDDRTIYEREVALLPRDASAHGMLGMVYLRERNLDASIREYEIALSLEPGYALGHSNYGMALELQGRRNEALAEYQRAVACDPRLAEAQFNLGRLLAAAGRRPAAIEHLEAALRLNPGLAEARRELERLR